jgi:hypothetical protein
MIAMAKRSHKSSLASFQVGDMRRLSRAWRNQFELCLLIGNTLPHLLSKGALRTTLRGIAGCLSAGGRLVIQTVNPGIMVGKDINFLAPKLANGGRLFQPLYICRGTHWDFHMVIISIIGKKVEESRILTTKLRFWSKAELVRTAREAGMLLEASFGSAALARYQPRQSENLILIFKKK